MDLISGIAYVQTKLSRRKSELQYDHPSHKRNHEERRDPASEEDSSRSGRQPGLGDKVDTTA